jgi:polyhydroxybutyrate depolymerase
VGSVVTIDGRTRTYRLHVPPALPDGPVPLLVALHGGTGSGRQFERSSGFDAVADDRGFIVVYPDGVGSGPDETDLRTWNAGLCCGAAARKEVDDVGFVRQLIDTMEIQFDIDPSRVFAAGHSNGGFMSYRLACELSDRIVAVGLQAGGLGVETCSPVRPVSLLHIHGAADTNVPIEGGVGSGISRVAFPPLADSLASVSKAMGCTTEPEATVDGAIATSTWSDCNDGVTVQLMLVDGQQHTWMTPPAFDSATTIVDFLFAHPRA